MSTLDMISKLVQREESISVVITSVGNLVPQLTAPALALLLVFRTEESYSRFEEARKAWNEVIDGTDDFGRQVISSVNALADLGIKKALLQYIIAFPFALNVSYICLLFRCFGLLGIWNQ